VRSFGGFGVPFGLPLNGGPGAFRGFFSWMEEFSSLLVLAMVQSELLSMPLDAMRRVDRLILISPAFFQNMGELFIRAQLRHFKLNRDRLYSKLLKKCGISIGILELNRLFSKSWSFIVSLRALFKDIIGRFLRIGFDGNLKR